MQAEGLVSTVRYSGFLFQTDPTSVVAKPDCRPYRSSHAGYQSVGLVVFDHDVVAVVKTAQFFTVASVNGGQIVVVVAHQFLAIEGDGSEAVRCHRGRRFGRCRLKKGYLYSTTQSIPD